MVNTERKWHTTSTTGKPTIMHHSYLHQEQGRNWKLMLSTNKEYMQCDNPNTNNLKSVDINLSNWAGPCGSDPDLPRSSTYINHNRATSSCSSSTTSM